MSGYVENNFYKIMYYIQLFLKESLDREGSFKYVRD